MLTCEDVFDVQWTQTVLEGHVDAVELKERHVSDAIAGVVRIGRLDEPREERGEPIVCVGLGQGKEVNKKMAKYFINLELLLTVFDPNRASRGLN